MREDTERNTVDAEAQRSGDRVSKVLGISVLVVLGCLILVGVMYFLQRGQGPAVPESLQLTGERLHAEGKTGKLIWSGRVTNRGSKPVMAPWVQVTLYNPDGHSVDSGEATTAASTIPANGGLSYTTTFNSRGSRMRFRSALEAPNTRPLGM